ncbi:MAG: hypothetical protein BJ554DRAFT_8412, partial [Olpidium bornovanus]
MPVVLEGPPSVAERMAMMDEAGAPSLLFAVRDGGRTELDGASGPAEQQEWLREAVDGLVREGGIIIPDGSSDESGHIRPDDFSGEAGYAMPDGPSGREGGRIPARSSSDSGRLHRLPRVFVPPVTRRPPVPLSQTPATADGGISPLLFKKPYWSMCESTNASQFAILE